MKSLKNLRQLDLSYNSVQGRENLQNLGLIRNLSHLDLRGNPVHQIPDYKMIITKCIVNLAVLDGQDLLQQSQVPQQCLNDLFVSVQEINPRKSFKSIQGVQVVQATASHSGAVSVQNAPRLENTEKERPGALESQFSTFRAKGDEPQPGLLAQGAEDDSYQLRTYQNCGE